MPMQNGAPGLDKHLREVRLRAAYAAYNQQDSETLLTLVSEDVDWPDGGARLHGKGELRAYWTHQWVTTRTHDEPVEIEHPAPDRSIVHVRQIVRALDGSTLSEGSFEHTYRFDGELIAQLDIRDAKDSFR